MARNQQEISYYSGRLAKMKENKIIDNKRIVYPERLLSFEPMGITNN